MLTRLLLLGWVSCAVIPLFPDRTPPPAGKTDRHGDPLPPGALMRLGTVRLRYPGAVTCLAFSPDGKTLATGGESGVRLWDATTGRPVRRLARPRERVVLLAFSADGKRLATAAQEENFAHWTVWDLATGAAKGSGNAPETRVASLALSPDGKQVAVGGPERTTQVLSLDGSKPPQQFDRPAVALAFSADGKHVALSRRDGRGTTIEFRDPANGKLLQGRAGPDHCSALAFSADGQRLFAASAGAVWVLNGVAWERTTKHALGSFTQNGPGRLADVSAHGDGAAAVLQRGKLVVWDGVSKQSHRCAQIESETTPLLALSPDGKRVAVTDGKSGHVRLFDAATGKERVALAEPAGHIQTLGFTADGKTLLAYGADRRLAVWALPAGTRREAFGSGEPLDGIALSHFGDRLATTAYQADERKLTVRVWDLRTGKRLRQQEFDELGRPTFLALAPDGETAAARQRGVCRIWDLKAGERADPDGLPTTLADIAFADDGKTLILGGRADRVIVFDGAAKKTRCSVVEFGATAVRFALSPNGRVLGVSFGNGPAVASLYDFHSGEPIRDLGRSRDRADSTGGLLPPAVEDFQEMRSGLHREGPSPVAFTPDGRCVAAADDRGVVHVWRIDTGEELSRFVAEDLVGALAFSPDGKRLAVGVAASVLVWDTSGLAERYAQKGGVPSPERLEQLWSALAGRDGGRAVGAVWELADAGDAAVAFLGKHLQPLAVDAGQIEHWIRDLQDRRYATRARAQDALARLDDAARPWLEKHLDNHPGVELRRRLELLLQPLDGPLPSAEKLRMLRSVEVLQLVGSPEACRVLERLAGGDGRVWLTGHARAVLGRVRAGR